MATNDTQIANFALAKLGTEQIISINSATVKEAKHAKLHYESTKAQVLRDHQWNFANHIATLSLIYPAMTSAISVITPYSAGLALEFESSLNMDSEYLYTAVGPDVFFLSDVTDAAGATVRRWTFWHTGGGSTTLKAYASAIAAHPQAVTAWLDATTHATYSGLEFVNPELGNWSYGYSLPADLIKVIKLEQETQQVMRFARGQCYSTQCLFTNAKPELFLLYTSNVTDTTQFDPLFEEAFVTLLASRMARAITGMDSAEGNLLTIYHGTILPQARFRDGQETASAENGASLASFLAGDMLTRRSYAGITDSGIYDDDSQ